jgi:chaperonin cofactor prefoldin
MTDNEIIKALECCMESECEKCQYQYDTACKEYIFHDCLSLIHRLMDKNKAYKHYYDECLKDLKKANTEIERLQAEAKSADGYADALVEYTKAEAIKEFAEELKKRSIGIRSNFDFKSDIDNLVKEMVGGDNNSLLVDKQN